VNKFKISPLDLFWGLLAILAGALVNYLGDLYLGVSLELFSGVATFSSIWAVDLFFVPFVAGLIVSFIFGLGGKILAYFSPIIVRGISYYQYNSGATPVPEGSILLELGFWILLVIVAVEAAAIGGVIGEVVIKKTYGRSPLSKIHKRYQKKPDQTK